MPASRFLGRWLLPLLAVLLAGLASAQPHAGAAGKRIALVIGNDSYLRVEKLRNARADATAIAKALEASGFRVILRLDAGEKAMKEAMRVFKGQIGGGDEAVFYFSGHGVQLGAANYLLPTDIDVQGEEQLKDDGLPLQRVLDDLQDQKARFSLAVIDACRNNPFRSAGRSIGGRGLAPTSAATGQMVIYSAGAGQQALDRLGDDDRNANGLFTRIFLREMSKPGIPVDRVLRGVREEVVRLAKSVGHEQVPALYDQALGEFYFRPGAVPAAPPAAPAAVDPAALELALWDSVKDSGQAAELNAYLEQYPQGRFAAVARSRLGQLAARPPAKTAPEPIVAPARPLAPVPAAVPSAPPQAAAIAVPVAGFPGRPLRLIVPFAPGGSADILARSLAGPLGQRLGQPVVVDNQPGAGGLIGAQAAAGSVADGHTLLLGNSAAIVIGPQLQPGTTVDPLRDLLAVAAVAHAPLLLAVPAASPHASPRALVDAARSKAGGLLYATSGPGSSSHLASVAFLAAAGVSATHVPYRGMAPALTDLLAGQVDFAFVDPAAALAQVRAGKLRLLAVSGRRRLADRPDLPTLAESGIGGAEMEVWHGIFVPAGTPGGIVAYLAAEIRRVLEQADFGQRLQQLAMSAGHPGTADFASYIREDASRTARWLRAGKIGGE